MILQVRILQGLAAHLCKCSFCSSSLQQDQERSTRNLLAAAPTPPGCFYERALERMKAKELGIELLLKSEQRVWKWLGMLTLNSWRA
jgi:hypothetical protein